MKGRVNYDLEVWCKFCGEKRTKSEIEFIPRFGYRCPECGYRCRAGRLYDGKKLYNKHPYEPVNMKRDLLLAKEKGLV